MKHEEEGSGKVLETMQIPAGLSVMKDGEPFFFPGGKVGCLLIHGFTGTTSSMKPMGEYLAQRGLTVLGPRLPGHGTDVKDMARYSFTDWVSVVETALVELQGICEKVFIGGLSMGGTLTLYLGERHPGNVSGLITVSAPVARMAPGIKNNLLKLAPLLKRLIKTFPGPGNDLKDPQVTEIAYAKLSTNAAHEAAKLGKQVDTDLHGIKVPIRIFHAREDHVVPPMNAVYIYEQVSSTDKELIWLENSYHVATLDLDKEKVFEESYQFIMDIAG